MRDIDREHCFSFSVFHCATVTPIWFDVCASAPTRKQKRSESEQQSLFKSPLNRIYVAINSSRLLYFASEFFSSFPLFFAFFRGGGARCQIFQQKFRHHFHYFWLTQIRPSIIRDTFFRIQKPCQQKCLKKNNFFFPTNTYRITVC